MKSKFSIQKGDLHTKSDRMKKTKGEWHFIDYAGFFCIVDEPFYEGKMLLDAEAVGYEAAKANAKLAVAAPELLKQLSNLVECWDNDTFQDVDIELARAAINKATI